MLRAGKRTLAREGHNPIEPSRSTRCPGENGPGSWWRFMPVPSTSSEPRIGTNTGPEPR